MSNNIYLHNQLTKLFLEKLTLEVPAVDTDLLEGGFLDSLQFVQLLFHLEAGFGISISLDDIELDNFRSIERIAEFVANHNPAKITR